MPSQGLASPCNACVFILFKFHYQSLAQKSSKPFPPLELRKPTPRFSVDPTSRSPLFPWSRPSLFLFHRPRRPVASPSCRGRPRSPDWPRLSVPRVCPPFSFLIFCSNPFYFSLLTFFPYFFFPLLLSLFLPALASSFFFSPVLPRLATCTSVDASCSSA
jgi:hypothetical protein